TAAGIPGDSAPGAISPRLWSARTTPNQTWTRTPISTLSPDSGVDDGIEIFASDSWHLTGKQSAVAGTPLDKSAMAGAGWHRPESNAWVLDRFPNGAI